MNYSNGFYFFNSDTGIYTVYGKPKKTCKHVRKCNCPKQSDIILETDNRDKANLLLSLIVDDKLVICKGDK